MSDSARGTAAALAAFLMWGGLSLYVKALAAIPATEVLAHRVLGGALFALLALMSTGGLREVPSVLADRQRLGPLLISSLAIGINWGLFIWAVGQGRALEASLGYFIFPLVTVLLARIVLGERLTRRRQAALAVVALGVAWLALRGQGVPWVALTLAGTFGLYGLLRKITPVLPLAGLLIETALLAPAAALYLVCEGGGAAPTLDADTIWLLALAGPVTAIPLWLFAYGARRLRLSTLGLMMYVNPTAQMLVAVFVFGEPFTPAYAVAFVAIWAGLALYSLPDQLCSLGADDGNA